MGCRLHPRADTRIHARGRRSCAAILKSGKACGEPVGRSTRNRKLPKWAAARLARRRRERGAGCTTWLKKPCEHCGAPAGQVCTTPAGSFVFKCHQSRWPSTADRKLPRQYG